MSSKKEKKQSNCKERTCSMLPDMFGRDISLLYEENISFKTNCGVFGTIMVILVIGMACSAEASKFLSQEVVSLEHYETHKANQIRQNSILNSVLSALGGADKIVSQGGMHIGIAFESNELFASGIIIHNYTSVPCDQVTIFSGYMKANPGMLCIRPSLEEIVENGIVLDTILCNEILNEGCINQSTLSGLNIYLEVNANDVYAASSIVQTSVKIIKVKIVKRIKKRVDISLIEYVSRTSSGMRLAVEGFRSILYKSNTESIQEIDPEDSLLEIRIEIDKDRQVVTYRKNYQLKDMISFIGGLMKGVTIIFFALVWPFREVTFYNAIVNEVFRVCATPEILERTMGGDSQDNPEDARNCNTPNSTRQKKTEGRLKQIVEKIEAMKKRYQVGGIFFRLIQDEKAKIEENMIKRSQYGLSLESPRSKPNEPLAPSRNLNPPKGRASLAGQLFTNNSKSNNPKEAGGGIIQSDEVELENKETKPQTFKKVSIEEEPPKQSMRDSDVSELSREYDDCEDQNEVDLSPSNHENKCPSRFESFQKFKPEIDKNLEDYESRAMEELKDRITNRISRKGVDFQQNMKNPFTVFGNELINVPTQIKIPFAVGSRDLKKYHFDSENGPKQFGNNSNYLIPRSNTHLDIPDLSENVRRDNREFTALEKQYDGILNTSAVNINEQDDQEENKRPSLIDLKKILGGFIPKKPVLNPISLDKASLVESPSKSRRYPII